MSETQFSRSDWRPGKRRRTQPRVRDYPGQKKAPAGLIAAGKLVGLHTNRAARCTATARTTGHRCKHVAMKGTTRCLTHGGGGMTKLFKLRPYVATMFTHAKNANGGKTNRRPVE